MAEAAQQGTLVEPVKRLHDTLHVAEDEQLDSHGRRGLGAAMLRVAKSRWLKVKGAVDALKRCELGGATRITVPDVGSSTMCFLQPQWGTCTTAPSMHALCVNNRQLMACRSSRKGMRVECVCMLPAGQRRWHKRALPASLQLLKR